MSSDNFPIVVALVMHNGARWLPHCLASLAQQSRQDFMLMLIDNGSVDSSVLLVNELLLQYPGLQARTKLVYNKQNLGFARAYNQAILWSSSEAVLILNQDVVLAPNYLELTMQGLEQQPRVGAVTGSLLQWNFDVDTFHISSLSEQGALVDSTGLVLWRSRRVTNRKQGERYDDSWPQEQEVFGIPATAALYRRAALEEASPEHQVFDESFVSYKEDVDLAWRLQLAGWQSWYVSQAIAYHDRKLSGGPQDSLRELAVRHRGFPRDYKLYSWVNHLATLIKNESWISLARDLPWFLSHEACKGGYLALTDPRVLFKGIVRLVRSLPLLLSERRSLSSTHRIKSVELRRWFTKSALATPEIKL